MKILVPIKRVPDYQIKVKVKADGSGIETDGIKWIVNPFDEIAIEEALKIKEAGKATEVVVLSIGPKEIEQQLRYGLAMGADSAILVAQDQPLDSAAAARVIAKIFKDRGFGLVLLGKQSIDSDASQTGQIVAELAQIPQATFASKVEIAGSDAVVTREVDGGLETIKVALPAVISTDLRLNTPRYASLPNIMKAKKKPLEEVTGSSLGLDLASGVRIRKMSAPAQRKGGKKVGSVAELVTALRQEAKVI